MARLGDFWLQEVLLPRDTLVAVGVAYHLTDLLLPELARCLQEGGAKGAAPGDATLRVLLEPFCAALAATHHPALVHRLRCASAAGGGGGGGGGCAAGAPRPCCRALLLTVALPRGLQAGRV